MRRAKIIYDVTWMIIAVLLASFLTVAFDLHERLIQYTRPLESWELDETPFLLFFVALSCAWFAYRRCHELVKEIAERRQVEKALTDSETRYRTLVEASAQGIYISQEGTIRFANRSLGRLFGYENPEALVGEDVGISMRTMSKRAWQPTALPRSQTMQSHSLTNGTGFIGTAPCSGSKVCRYKSRGTGHQP